MNQDRIHHIDVLRGFALLGLPTMNIIHFAMPQAAYINPIAYDADGFANHLVFSFFDIFANQKFMGLFTLLFGASLILLRNKNLEQQNNKALIHYSRMFVLGIIGYLHGAYLWSGDILFLYAIVGMLLYPLARLSSKPLFFIATLLLLLANYFMQISHLSPQAIGQESYYVFQSLYEPDAAQIERQSDLILGDYNQLRAFFNDAYIDKHFASMDDSEQMLLTFWVFASFGFSVMFKMLGMVCLGMALFKAQFIQGCAKQATYLKVAVITMTIGLSLSIGSLALNYQDNWDMQSFFQMNWAIGDAGSIFMTVAYAAILIALLNAGKLLYFGFFVAKVGRMALTNYLMQSLICALIFYGYAYGAYGSLSRLELIPIVFAIWLIQLLFSYFYLKYFAQGPVEWLWRTVSEASFYPFLKK